MLGLISSGTAWVCELGQSLSWPKPKPSEDHLVWRSEKRGYAESLCCIALAFLLGGGTAYAADELSCVCEAAVGCGLGGVGGDQGDIITSVSPAAAEKYFTTNPDTGWICVKPAKSRGNGGPEGCFCKATCGNGGMAGEPNYFDLGLKKDQVNSSYGGGKPGNTTGWLCGTWRGDFAQ